MPDEFLGSVIKLCIDRRGTQMKCMLENKFCLVYDLPMSEIVMDFLTNSSQQVADMLPGLQFSSLSGI